MKIFLQLWLLLGAIFAASCLANPQRPGKQGKGAVQSKQNKKPQAPNNTQKSSGNSQNAQRRVASGKANARNPAAQPKIANENRPNQQRNRDAVNPGMVKPSNKKVSSKIGSGAAAGAALAGGAAVMSMPAIWNDEVLDGGDDSNAPPGAVGIAVGEPSFPGDMPPFDIGKDYMNNMQLCVMPYAPFLPFPDKILGPDFMQPFPRPMLPQIPMPLPAILPPDFPMFPPLPMNPMQPPNIPELPSMPPMPPMMWPADLQSSDEPPNISPDTDPTEAKNQKTNWLLLRFLQNKPYSLDDPKLNLTEEEKSYFAKNLPALPAFVNSMIGGSSLPQGAPDASKMSIPGTSDTALADNGVAPLFQVLRTTG